MTDFHPFALFNLRLMNRAVTMARGNITAFTVSPMANDKAVRA